MKKDYLSATRFSKAVYCGFLGYHLSNEETKLPAFIFQRGKELHGVMDQIFQEGKEVEGGIPEHFRNFLPGKDEIIQSTEHTKVAEYEGKKLKCVGTADLMTKDLVIEFKSGKYAEWHKWQAAFYKWLLGLKHGRILYFDIPDLVIDLPEDEKKFVVTDELVIKTWNNVLLKKATRCSLCSSCPAKKQCPEWKGVATEDMLDLVDTINLKQQLEERKKEIVKQLLEPLDNEITQLEEKEKNLRQKIVQEMPKENIYEFAGARIQISLRSFKVLPEDFKPPRYEESPELFKEPVLDRTAVLKKFGIEVKKPVLSVRME